MIATLVKIITDFILSLISKAKLENLTKIVIKNKENTDEKLKKSTDSYTTFMQHYNDWLDSEERRLQSETKDVHNSSNRSTRSLSESTSDNKRTAGTNRKSRKSNKRAKSPIRGRKR